MPIHCHYAVCPTSTDDVKTGSPTISITAGVAVLSVPQTGNIGCGYEIDFGAGEKVYIGAPDGPVGISPQKSAACDGVWGEAMSSNQSFKVVTADAGAPGDCTDETVNSIKAVWSSLTAAMAAYLGANYINNSSLVAADVVVHLWCYGGATPDPASTTINGATTDATRYLDIRVPMGLATYGECLRSTNYHWGVWSDVAYRMEVNDAANVLVIEDEHVHIDGLAIESKNTSGYIYILDLSGADHFYVDNLLLKDTSGSGEKHYGIYFAGSAATSPSHVRNVVTLNTTSEGIRGGGTTSSGDLLACNVTIIRSGHSQNEDGVEGDYRAITVKNAIVYYSTKDDFYGDFHSDSDYCFSSDGTEPGAHSGSTVVEGWLPEWEDNTYGSEDMRLTEPSDARGRGIGPDLDSDVPIYDIAGNPRSGDTCDIGAFEYVEAAAGGGSDAAVLYGSGMGMGMGL